MHKFLLLCTVAALGFGGCATTTSPVSGPVAYADTTSPESKLFGEYLIGSYADRIEDAQVRSVYYTRAFERANDDVSLGVLALKAAIAADDFKLAFELAEDIAKLDASEPMARMMLGARAFSKRRYDAAESYFETSTSEASTQIMISLMRGWNDAARSKPDRAKSIFTSLGGGGYFSLLGNLQSASLEATQGDSESINAAFEKLEGVSLLPRTETALAKTRALSLAGDIDGALAFIEAFNESNGPYETGPVRRYIQLLKTGASVAKTLKPHEEAARALAEPAYEFFMPRREDDLAEIYLRMALFLDSENHNAAIWLGRLIEGQGRKDEAMRLFQSVPDSSPYFIAAKLSEANIHFRNEENEKALALLESVNENHKYQIMQSVLGQTLFVQEEYERALGIYTALIDSMSADELKANVDPIFSRGLCYEQLGQWDKAVADYKRVLEIDPNDADVLNHLGYSWVDRNENLETAFEMIRKAVELRPNSGAIVDSLGWAHYKLGHYEKARVQLEKAAELSPSSATIIDHLGDVYWKVGRFREAGYQWKRALDFDPTDKERENIKIKLESGLDAVEALP